MTTIEVLNEKAGRTDKRLADHDERISGVEKTVIQIVSDNRATRWIIGIMIALSTLFLTALKFVGGS